jgi:hypothetical protein
MISHSGSSGTTMGSSVPHPISSTSANAAAWRGFIRSVYQNAKVRNSDLPTDAVPIRAECLNFNF